VVSLAHQSCAASSVNTLQLTTVNDLSDDAEAWLEFERRRRALIAAGNDIFRDASASTGTASNASTAGDDAERASVVVLLCA
jgi:hypothetical protein